MTLTDYLLASAAALAVTAPLAPLIYRRWRRFMIARAIRTQITAYRIGRAATTQEVVGEMFGNVAAYALGDMMDASPAALLASMSRRVSPHPRREKMSAGRQAISVGEDETDIFGRGGHNAFRIPDDARVVKWEACHLFSPYSGKPRRTTWGLECQEPPLAMVCAECEMRQPALNYGQRRCGYCGALHQVHGTLVYVWREATAAVPEWRP